MRRAKESLGRWTAACAIATIGLLLSFVVSVDAHRRAGRSLVDPQEADPVVSVRLGLAQPWRVVVAVPSQVNGERLEAGTYDVAWRGVSVEMRGPSHHTSANGLQLSSDAPVTINGRAYRGSLLFRRYSILNRLSMQDYLRGVVGSEIGSQADLEAMKAQTVVARTYTFAHMGSGEIADDTSFQVYRGMEVENPTVVRAVDETAGQILMYQGHLAREVCYHSTCGGHTEDNENVFLTAPIPYLRGVACTMPETSRPAPSATGEEVSMVALEVDTIEFPSPDTVRSAPPPRVPAGSDRPRASGKGWACEQSNWAHWIIRWPAASVPSMQILKTSASGRVVRLRVGGRVVSGDDIRHALRFRDTAGRTRSLYSTNFTLRREGDLIIAEGSGWGHGVGLCQWGARGLARAGVRYTDILTHYYPGTEVMAIVRDQRGGGSDGGG